MEGHQIPHIKSSNPNLLNLKLDTLGKRLETGRSNSISVTKTIIDLNLVLFVKK